MTGAYKYALRQLFAIPTGDDAEKDQPRERQQRDERPAATEADRDALRKAWHARLGALKAANLIPGIDDTERHAVQLHCWGVKSISDLDPGACRQQLETLRATDDGTFAALIRNIIGADA
jgi:hypothetical protein